MTITIFWLSGLEFVYGLVSAVSAFLIARALWRTLAGG